MGQCGFEDWSHLLLCFVIVLFVNFLFDATKFVHVLDRLFLGKF